MSNYIPVPLVSKVYSFLFNQELLHSSNKHLFNIYQIGIRDDTDQTNSYTSHRANCLVGDVDNLTITLGAISVSYKKAYGTPNQTLRMEKVDEMMSKVVLKDM